MLSLWIRKEAYLKARGLGLQTPLGSFTVSLDAESPALLSVEGVPDEPRRWNFVNIDVGPNATGVVVFSGAAREVLKHTIPAGGLDV